MTLTLPTVHLNGTSRRMLIDDYTEAYGKLLEFRDAFQKVEFNARDYYVQGSGAFTDACHARDEQRQRIADLMTYLEAHLTHLSN